jgi:hypothetical protein
MTRQEDAERNVGDDLTDAQLDDLWNVLVNGATDSYMARWWADKKHQIAYRLLMRLTRAERERMTYDPNDDSLDRDYDGPLLPDQPPPTPGTGDLWREQQTNRLTR